MPRNRPRPASPARAAPTRHIRERPGDDRTCEMQRLEQRQEGFGPAADAVQEHHGCAFAFPDGDKPHRCGRFDRERIAASSSFLRGEVSLEARRQGTRREAPRTGSESKGVRRAYDFAASMMRNWARSFPPPAIDRKRARDMQACHHAPRAALVRAAPRRPEEGDGRKGRPVRRPQRARTCPAPTIAASASVWPREHDDGFGRTRAEGAGAGERRDELGEAPAAVATASTMSARRARPASTACSSRAETKSRKGAAPPSASVAPAAMACPPPLSARPASTAAATARPRSAPSIERPEPVIVPSGAIEKAKAGRRWRSFSLAATRPTDPGSNAAHGRG